MHLRAFFGGGGGRGVWGVRNAEFPSGCHGHKTGLWKTGEDGGQEKIQPYGF